MIYRRESFGGGVDTFGGENVVAVEDLKETSHAPHVFVNMFFKVLISYNVYTFRSRHLFCLFNFTYYCLWWFCYVTLSLFLYLLFCYVDGEDSISVTILIITTHSLTLKTQSE
jgi:hypothetical protein